MAKVHGSTYPDVRDLPNYNLASASSDVAVTKHDTNEFADGTCRGLWVGTAGTANLTQDDGTERVNFPLKEGPNPIRVKRVKTGGSADDMWALY
jgi:hypothetical protein